MRPISDVQNLALYGNGVWGGEVGNARNTNEDEIQRRPEMRIYVDHRQALICCAMQHRGCNVFYFCVLKRGGFY